MKINATKELGTGERLRIVRLQNRLSQSEMAEKLGISVSQYSKIEVGLRNIGKKPLHIMCKDFGVTSDYLLYGNTSKAMPKEDGPHFGDVSPNSAKPALTLMDALAKIARELGISFETVSKCFSELANKSKNGEIK